MTGSSVWKDGLATFRGRKREALSESRMPENGLSLPNYKMGRNCSHFAIRLILSRIPRHSPLPDPHQRTGRILVRGPERYLQPLDRPAGRPAHDIERPFRKRPQVICNARLAPCSSTSRSSGKRNVHAYRLDALLILLFHYTWANPPSTQRSTPVI